MSDTSPIICAIDTQDLSRAVELAVSLAPYLAAIKLGLEFFTANGPQGVKKVAENGTPIFLDLKLHDIPNTVSKAIIAAAEQGVSMLTVHTLGGRSMLEAARDTAKKLADVGKTPPMLLGVTLLTSLGEDDLHEIGVLEETEPQVLRLAALAHEISLCGVVCAAHEIAAVRSIVKDDCKIIVPGIRPEGTSSGDQTRVATPKEAIEQGADYLVIGRPITEHADPVAAVKEIQKSITA